MQAKPEKKQFALVDTHANEHKLQPLNHAVSLARYKLQDRRGANKASSADRRCVLCLLYPTSPICPPQVT